MVHKANLVDLLEVLLHAGFVSDATYQEMSQRTTNLFVLHNSGTGLHSYDEL